jgi:dTDP-4-amino-4,6-dideoxygalactose transaminase
MCDQPAYQPQPDGACPNGARLIREILCLPAHEKLERADVEYVATAVGQFYGTA